MKTPTSKSLRACLLLGLAFLGGCRVTPPVDEQDRAARRLLTDLNRAGSGDVATVHAAGADGLHQFQPLPDFTRTVETLNRRVGRLKTVTRTDAQVSRSMAEEKTNLIYHLTGDKGQADLKIYLTRRRGQWVLDGLRVGDNP